MSDLTRQPTGEGPLERPPGGDRQPVVVPPAADDDVAVGQYLRALSRRRWLALGVAAAVVALVAIQVFTTTPLYRARALVQIDPEQPKIVPYQEVSETGFSDRTSQEYLATQVTNLQTRDLARRVIRRLDLVERPAFTATPSAGLFSEAVTLAKRAVRALLPGGGERPSRPGETGAAGEEPVDPLAVERLRSNLRVGSIRDTRLVEVSYVSADPALAAELVNALIEEFVEQRFEVRYRATIKAADFLQGQITELRRRLEESEAELVAYARANDIVALDERSTIDSDRLAALNTELSRLEAVLGAERARQEALAEATPERFPADLRTPLITELESDLAGLESDLANLRSRYGPRWPAVVGLAGELEEVRARLAAEKQGAIDAARRDYRVALSEYREIAEALDAQRRAVENLAEDSIRYSMLEREVETNKELYQGLLQRLREAGVMAGLRSSNVHVSDPAVAPLAPSEPQRGVALSLALLVGLMLGVGAAVVAEALDDTLKSSEDVGRQLGLPALGMIPSLVGPDANGSGPSARAGELDGDAPMIAFGLDPVRQARVLEAYRSLRTSLLLSHSGQPPQVIQVTSATPGEGKTTTVVNMAMVLARTGARTLVADLDLRKPELARLFGESDQQGLTTYLTGGSTLSALLRETSVPNLFLLGAGPAAPNPPELLGSARMASALDLLREYFSYIVLDTPPALELTDALVVSPRADGVLLVARSGTAPREAVRRAHRRLTGVGAKVLGVVVNDVDPRALESELGYYFGDYPGIGVSPSDRPAALP